MAADIQRALVTGGAGFIGSHLADALLKGGAEVVVLDNLSTGRRDNLANAGDRIHWIEGDIRDRETLDRAVAGCDTVFHQAAVVSVPKTVDDPVTSAQVNEIGTLNVLEAARAAGVRRVVLASSSAIYGDDPTVPKTEAMAALPRSPYAVQKRVGEHYARLYTELYGLSTVCLRYFNVFGPRQDPGSPYSGVISIFMSRAVDGQPPLIHGDGEQYRDFIYVTDVVRANLLAATRPGIGGTVFNIGTGRSVSINRLWDLVCDLTGRRLDPAYGPTRAGDIRESVADVAAAADGLEFTPEHAFQAGLTATFDWYKETRS